MTASDRIGFAQLFFILRNTDLYPQLTPMFCKILTPASIIQQCTTKPSTTFAIP